LNGTSRPELRLVVKLGGSLAASTSLAQWLHELTRNRSARFVVVPGGGPFADAVRAAQHAWQFNDQVAHAMALGAMDQFGQMLCGIEAGAVACTTRLQIGRAWLEGGLPVWLPARLVSRERRLARSWDVTSDTIAAWLAEALGANGLLLVKSCELPADGRDPVELAAAGIVDQALPGFLSRSGIALQVLQRDRWIDLSRVVTRMACRV
jgi:5-(aminomethyl)-3-furanmethanol phosphate kinase